MFLLCLIVYYHKVLTSEIQRPYQQVSGVQRWRWLVMEHSCTQWWHIIIYYLAILKHGKVADACGFGQLTIHLLQF